MTPQTFIAKWGAPDGVPGPAYQHTEAVEDGAPTPEYLPESYMQNVPMALYRIGFTATTVANPKANAMTDDEIPKCLLALNLAEATHV